MDKLQRIFAAIDFSSGSDEALRQAHERAVFTRAKLAVCHIVPNELRSHLLFPHISRIASLNDPFELERVAETASARVMEVTGRTQAEFDLIVDEGTPYAAILTHAEKWLADLIVAGSHGAAASAAGLRLGSVANKITQYAHCAVLIARPCRGTGGIVAGTDFSDPALPALRAAAVEARRTKGDLTIVHSLDLVWPAAGVASMALGGSPFNISDEQVRTLEDLARQRLDDALKQLHIQGQAFVTRGPAEIALIETAAHLKADLLVVGTVGRTGLRRLLLGSVAGTVVTEAPCSVLMVRRHPG